MSVKRLNNRNRYGSLLAGNTPAPPPGDFSTIATVTLASTASIVTFNSIPSTFKHLEIHGYGRTTNGVGIQDVTLQFNASSTGTYRHWGYGFDNDSTIYMSNGSAQGPSSVGYFPGTAVGTSFTGAFYISILNYAATDRFKVARYLSGNAKDSGGNAVLTRGGQHWRSTDAITRIDLNTSNMAPGTSFTLYGLRGD